MRTYDCFLYQRCIQINTKTNTYNSYNTYEKESVVAVFNVIFKNTLLIPFGENYLY